MQPLGPPLNLSLYQRESLLTEKKKVQSYMDQEGILEEDSGNILSGKHSGKGSLVEGNIHKIGEWCDGTFLHGYIGEIDPLTKKWHGKGKEIKPTGDWLEGHWSFGIFFIGNMQKTYTKSAITPTGTEIIKSMYVGACISSTNGKILRHGTGTTYYDDGTEETGFWNKDKKDGVFKGKFTNGWAYAVHYEDGFLNPPNYKVLGKNGISLWDRSASKHKDQKQMTFPDNTLFYSNNLKEWKKPYHFSYLGPIEDDCFEETGRLENYVEGWTYRGEFQKGQFEGEGKLIHKAGNWKYEGPFSRGKFHGENGRFTFPNGDECIGSFKNGKFHGEVKVIATDGTTVSSEYEDGNWITMLD